MLGSNQTKENKTRTKLKILKKKTGKKLVMFEQSYQKKNMPKSTLKPT